jgi:hypothetical protein
MKLPQEQALWIHAFITAVFVIACVALIVFSHNAAAITFSLAALPTLYAIWVPSPTQQSTSTAIMALIQRLEPMIAAFITSSVQSATTPTVSVPVPAQVATVQPAPATETDVTASMKAVSPAKEQANV